MRAPRPVAWSSLAVCLAACSLGTDWESLTRGTNPSSTAPDGGAVEAGGDASPNEGGPTGTTRCDAPGAILRPAVAYEATPNDGNGTACNVENALAEDGAVAGVDRTYTGRVPEIDGEAVNGCLGVELAEETRLAKVVVRMAAANDACGVSPCEPNPEGCGTGRDTSIFVGTSRESLEVLAAVPITSELQTYTLDVNQSVKVVVVCRNAWGDKRDDVVVDAIYGICP